MNTIKTEMEMQKPAAAAARKYRQNCTMAYSIFAGLLGTYTSELLLFMQKPKIKLLL